MGDVPAGEYVVRVRVAGRLYVRRVAVEAGQVAWVHVRAARREDVLPLLQSPLTAGEEWTHVSPMRNGT